MATLTYRSEAGSFFAAQQTSTADSPDLISAQVDPTQPQVDGLTPVSDPVLPDTLLVNRLSHMDPSLYDLRPTSHLMRFITALVGAAGVGGLRKQQLMSRLSGSLSGTHFLDLDGFWGALFALPRSSVEAMPTNDDGSPFDPFTQSATSDTWDQISASDGTYRSRISQFARAVNTGATYFGIIAAAEAILGIEVELMEAWTLADQIPPGTTPSVIAGNSWLAVRSLYPTWGALSGASFSTLEGGIQIDGEQSPLGNRGEVFLRPKRAISLEEKYELGLALKQLLPSGVLLTIFEEGLSTQQSVPASSYYSDSENWNVVSVVTERPGLVAPGTDIYPNQSARPAFSQYTGEAWTYNSRVSGVQSYTMTDDVIDSTSIGDFDTVTFLDGTSHSYLPVDGVMTPYQSMAARAASDGVLTAYPYSGARV